MVEKADLFRVGASSTLKVWEVFGVRFKSLEMGFITVESNPMSSVSIYLRKLSLTKYIHSQNIYLRKLSITKFSSVSIF